MLLIKSIEFVDEITDVDNGNVDIFVTAENGYTYTIPVATPAYFLEEMDQEKTNFISPRTPAIIVKKLTQEIVEESVLAYAEYDGYWLKLHQFADTIDISVLNKLEAEHREEGEILDLEGLDLVLYYIKKYIQMSLDNPVLLSAMAFFTLITFISYWLLKPELMNSITTILD